MRFLVVDDDMTTREVICGILEEYGECVQCGDGKQAIDRYARDLESGGYDLLVMDIMMPEMDGHEALKAIREMEDKAGKPPVKTIMLSTLDDNYTIMKAQFVSGANAYITKPVDAESLQEAMEAFALI